MVYNYTIKILDGETMKKTLEDIKSSLCNELNTVLYDLEKVANFKPGDILVVGCSTSEVMGDKIGTCGSEECASVLVSVLDDFCTKHQIFLAAQCCEHLNRAIVITQKAYDYHRMNNRVNVIPHAKAGGSFATAVYKNSENPVVVENISADAGIDIGDTFIGMHLKAVAVPVRSSVSSVGMAHVTLARTRFKFVGGERAAYNSELN